MLALVPLDMDEGEFVKDIAEAPEAVMEQLYPLNAARIAMRLRREGEPRPWTVGAFLMLSKLPEALGWLRYQAGRFTGRRSKLIEYKAAEQSDQ